MSKGESGPRHGARDFDLSRETLLKARAAKVRSDRTRTRISTRLDNPSTTRGLGARTHPRELWISRVLPLLSAREAVSYTRPSPGDTSAASLPGARRSDGGVKAFSTGVDTAVEKGKWRFEGSARHRGSRSCS